MEIIKKSGFGEANSSVDDGLGTDALSSFQVETVEGESQEGDMFDEAEKVKEESTETKVKEENVNKQKRETLLSPVTKKSNKKVLRITDIGWPKNQPTIKKWENLGS